MEIRNRRITATLFALVLLAVSVSSWSCGTANQDSDVEEPLVLRTYRIEPDLAPELNRIFNGLLAQGEGMPPVGRVEIGPDNQLLVAAPARIHEGITLIVAEVNNSSPTPPPMIDMTYWFLTGNPAESTSWPPRIQELESAFEGIVNSEGPTKFQLLEKVRFHSLSSETGRSESQLYWIQQTATARDGQVIAHLDLDSKGVGGDISSHLVLKPNQLLVLGQSALPDQVSNNGFSDTSIFIVIRSQISSIHER